MVFPKPSISCMKRVKPWEKMSEIEGIPEELKNQVFDPFFTTNPDGSGIGLRIAQRIILDHDGTIEIMKNKWGGATFRIKLPIEKRMSFR